MKIHTWNTLTEQQQTQLLQRPELQSQEDLRAKTAEIIAEVRARGDTALKDYTVQFDHVQLDDLTVSPQAFAVADDVSEDARAAMQLAIRQIEAVHQAQMPQELSVEATPGVKCVRQTRPIARVGLYVPGGSAPLISTLMMLAVPAKIAGCPLRVLCTPPNKDGQIDAHILAAAQLCGIDKIFKIGGAQAVAAMAYGTATIPKVDKIFGPGNAWVTQAKILVAQDPQGASYDLPAGPSEVLVIADETANAEFVALDLLSQAEHDVAAQVILLTTSMLLGQQICGTIERQLAKLPRRKIIEQSLAHSRLLVVDDIATAIAISNRYAPEHLIMQVAEAEQHMAAIHYAGTVFLGSMAAEVLGDYVTGSNHVLPTYGFARVSGGLALTDFLKFISFQSMTAEGLQAIGPAAEKLAEIEGLHAHQQAVSVRLKDLKKGEK
ncbi:MAG: histidinol dehydrogenase [Gammaproteobacteria bacterium]